MNVTEYFFQCPYCWETVSMLIDTSQTSQSYIEDFEVCCNPIQLDLKIENNMIIQIETQNIEQ